MLNYLARLTPRRPAESEKCVERILRENLLPLKLWRTEVSQLFQNRKIENVLTDRDADMRRTLFRFEDSKGQVLDWKMRIASNVDKRFKRRHSLNNLRSEERRVGK